MVDELADKDCASDEEPVFPGPHCRRRSEETPIFLTGLCLKEVPTALVQQAGRSIQDSQIQAGLMSLGRWQPDIVGMSLAKKTIAIGPEVSPPSDT